MNEKRTEARKERAEYEIMDNEEGYDGKLNINLFD